MLFADITVLNADFQIAPHQYVGVRGDKIAFVGDCAPTEDFGEVYDGKNRLLMPALVNAHSHAAMTLLRGYAENLPLQRWLEDRVFPFEDKIQDEDAYYSTALAIAEMIRTGTASFTDMYFFSEQVLRAVADSGIKCNFGRAITSFADCDIAEIPSFQESENLINTYHNACDGRIKIDMSLHAEYTNRRTVIEQFGESVKAHGLRAHIHLSETEKEHEECKQRHGGLTPAELFAACGVFDVPCTAAHCVWVTAQDREIFKEKGVTVATNPASNLKLGSGVCDVYALLQKGVNVALGTDSVASNNNLDMFKEMYLCALLPKGIRRQPDIVSERDVLKIATVNGWRSQGRDDSGVIAVGNKADLIAVDLDTVHMSPHNDTINNLVYAASGEDVVLTMADGKALYRDGEYLTLDIEKIKFEVEQRTRRIQKEVKANA
ncbi:MAG: amidohydrolase [Ruminococcus sp.]|nr:amidohydrolase [Ruminococcus sp.]